MVCRLGAAHTSSSSQHKKLLLFTAIQALLLPLAERSFGSGRRDAACICRSRDHTRDRGLQHVPCALRPSCCQQQRMCAGGRLVFLLEGGYSSKGLASSVVESFLALLDQDSRSAMDSSVPAEPQHNVEGLIKMLRALHDL